MKSVFEKSNDLDKEEEENGGGVPPFEEVISARASIFSPYSRAQFNNQVHAETDAYNSEKNSSRSGSSSSCSCCCSKRFCVKSCKALTLISLGLAVVSGLYFGAVSMSMSLSDPTKLILETHNCTILRDCRTGDFSTESDCFREFCSQNCSSSTSLASIRRKSEEEGDLTFDQIGKCPETPSTCIVNFKCESRYHRHRMSIKNSRRIVQIASLVLLVFAFTCCLSTVIVTQCLKRCCGSLCREPPEEIRRNEILDSNFIARLGQSPRRSM